MTSQHRFPMSFFFFVVAIKKRADQIPPVDSPFVYWFIKDVAVPAVMNGKNSVVNVSFEIIQNKLKDLWFDGGLGWMVQKSHCLWRGCYIRCIHGSIGKSFLAKESFIHGC